MRREGGGAGGVARGVSDIRDGAECGFAADVWRFGALLFYH